MESKKSALEQGEARRKELLELLSKKEQKEAKKLNKDVKNGEEVKELGFKFRKGREDSICLTIPQNIQSANMTAYCWNNAEQVGGDFEEYEYFKIYDNNFQSISANRDINKGIWSKEYHKYVRYTEEEFLAELRVMYCILTELNPNRFERPDESIMKVNLFFRKVLINIQKNSKYDFNRKYVLARLGKWRINYLKNPNQTLLELKRILGNRGKIVRERDFMLRDDVVIKQVEGEHNSFLSRLSEDRKRHSIKNLFSSGLISDLRSGYLRPIMADDLNLCKRSHKEIKKLVNKYNEELTGGTDKRHLSSYVEVAEYVSECFNNYMMFNKMCKVSTTLYYSTNIGCHQVYTQFVESKYFPKVSDVVRELNINNRRSITKSLTSLKRPIEKAVETAESILMLMHSESYEVKNIETNGKNRLAIVPIEDREIVVRKIRATYINDNLQKYLNNFATSIGREDLFYDYEVDYSASLEYYRDNDFNIDGWNGSESMPQLIQKEESGDLLELVKDIERSCSSLVKLDSNQVKLYM